MTDLLLRHLDEDLMRRLCAKAAQNGRSVEDEALAILQVALKPPPPAQKNLSTAVRARLAAVGGVELHLPGREPMRDPPDFDTDPDP